jgi:nitrogen fixation-related uncharacterized protein
MHSGCCCDTRKAVFVINIVSICLYVLGVISIAALARASKQKQFDDDAVQAAMNNIDGVKIGFAIGTYVVGMICNGVAIYGAAYFNKIAIIVGGLWCVFEFVRSVTFFDVGSAVMAAGFCYPHVVFYYEMKSGIMSRETYPQEMHCCECCNK